ncbi:hemolysin III family protein [Candidatus Bipolaricaulota bacterium]|nr:hemolysin III family protein [Candidatus Bipolaricaulota bacterium]
MKGSNTSEEVDSRLYYTKQEEVANSASHGLGALLSAIGFFFLIVRALPLEDTWSVASVSIFGATLFLAHLASTFYHAFRSEKVKRVLQLIDHGAIYLLVAGTFTPFLLITLRSAMGWLMFSLVWSFAFIGIIFKSLFINRFPKFGASTYVIMGFLSIFIMKSLYIDLPLAGFLWILIGCAVYLLGLIFLGWHSLPYNHMIWHIFVMGGSASHFVVIYFYVLPRG